MDNITIVALQNLYPLPNTPIHCRLVRKIFERVMVSLDSKVSAREIMTPLTYSPDDAQQLPFICTVSTFGRV